MEETKEDNTDTFRDEILEAVVRLGFVINAAGSLYGEPRFYSEQKVLGMIIIEVSDITNYFMEKFQITEEEYKELVSKYIKEDKIITIERDTGYGNVEFG
jgi:hypothetical protein